MRLRDGGVFSDDSFIKRPALEPLTGGQQGVGESELSRKIIGPPPNSLFECMRRLVVFAQRSLNQGGVINPAEIIGRQMARPFIADCCEFVILVSLKRHAQSPIGLGVIRMSLCGGMGFAQLVSDFSPEFFKRYRGQARRSLSSWRQD